MSHPFCAKVYNAMKQHTGALYHTGEQDKDLTISLQEKKKYQYVILSTTAFRANNETIQIDQQLLHHSRLTE